MLRSSGGWDSIIAPYAISSAETFPEAQRTPSRHRRSLRRVPRPTARAGLQERVPAGGANCGNEASAAAAPHRAAPHISVRRTVWRILKETPSAQDYLEQVFQASPEVSVAAKLAKSSSDSSRSEIFQLTPWFEAAKTTAQAGFASHLTRDRDAVEAALKLP